MSKIISVLEKMASDAAISGESAIADLVATSDINDGQMQAIKANDVEALVESTSNLPSIKSFIIIPAEDDDKPEQEEDADKEVNNILKSVVNI